MRRDVATSNLPDGALWSEPPCGPLPNGRTRPWSAPLAVRHRRARKPCVVRRRVLHGVKAPRATRCFSVRALEPATRRARRAAGVGSCVCAVPPHRRTRRSCGCGPWPCLGLALAWRTGGNARPSGLGKTDGDGLLRRSRPMLATADLVNLFANEFAGLSRGRFARALVLTSLLDCSLVRHDHSPLRPVDRSMARAAGGAAPRHTRACLVNARGNQIDPCATLNDRSIATLFLWRRRERRSMADDRPHVLSERDLIPLPRICRRISGRRRALCRTQKAPPPGRSRKAGSSPGRKTPRARRPTGIQRLNLLPVAPMVGGSVLQTASARPLA